MQLGTSDEVRQAVYRELFKYHVDADTLNEICEALNHEVVHGRSYFKDRIEELTKRRARVGQPGRPLNIEEVEGVYLVGY